MIKYFCDRCGKQVSDRVYTDEMYDVSVVAGNCVRGTQPNDLEYKLCQSCYFAFKDFIKGDKSNG